MKTALCSVVSDEFVAGFICMYRSLLQHNPGWDFPFYIFSHRDNCPLSPQGRALIAAHCDKAIFIEVDNAGYEGIFDYAENVIGTPRRLRAAFYILESFRFCDYDRIISLDSDILVLGSLEELLLEGHRFSAVRARHPRTDEPSPFVNTGLMVIGKHYLHADMLEEFTAALKTRPLIPRSGKADQAIINVFFGNRLINYLPPVFNFTKRSVFNLLGKERATDPETVAGFLAEREVRILHYVGEKPWDAKVRLVEMEYQVIEDLWFQVFYSVANVAAIQWMDRRRRVHETLTRNRLAETSRELAAKKRWENNDFQEKVERQLRQYL